ncbi:MAG: uroporphyrinogen-III C-methyltransferase [Nitrospinota bacterium]
MKQKEGIVYLVGAGPGDYELITVKGKRLIAEADLIVRDYLAHPKLLEFASTTTEILYVGKQGGAHSKSQDEINKILIDECLAGKKIVRLKGGDPYIFGRGAEEVEELVKAGCRFEVVPGVTAASGATSYSGIPLTHRDFNTTLTLVTGHEDPTKAKSSINWGALASSATTLVFYMGIKNLPIICNNLMKEGLDGDTPVAIVRWATLPYQQTITGTLNNIVEIANSANIKPPAIIIVGHVVSLKEKLDWYESRLLFGKKIIVTRAREQSSEFAMLLTNLGAEAIEFPTIATTELQSYKIFDDAVANMKEFDFVIFTSANGVKYFLKRVRSLGLDIRILADKILCAIGPKTADELYKLGLTVDLIPDEYRAERIIEALQAKYTIEGSSFLIPRAAVARDILPDMLTKLKGEVTVAPIYETILPSGGKEDIKELFSNNEIELVTFTSSSTVTNFIKMWDNEEQAVEILKSVKVASIGPITSSTANKFGIKPDIEADQFTIEGLVDKIKASYCNP